MPAVQAYAREQIVLQLKTKLNVDLGIGSLHFQPFNSVELKDVYIHDQKDKTIFKADRLYANIDVLDLFREKITVNSLRLANFDVHLSKETKESPLNIQFIVDAFKSKTPPSKNKFDIKLTAINISDGSFHFDIDNQAAKEGRFDPNHIDVSNLNARLALKSLRPDSFNIEIKSLNLEEKSGVKIRNLITRVITQKTTVSIKGFKLDLPKSYLQFDKCEIDLSKVKSSKDLLDHATFECSTTSSYVALKDISSFVPLLKNFEDRIYLKTKISGSIDNLKVSNLALDYGEKMHLVANAEVKDIRMPDKVYLLGSIDELKITKDGIEGILNNFSGDKKSIPKELTNLGTVSFTGDLSGYINQLTAFGNFKTDLGSVTTDLLFGFHPNKDVDVFFNGKVSTPKFDLGKLTNKKDLGNLSFDLSVNLKKPTGRKIGGKVDGQIHELDYKGYTYKDIAIDGTYDGLKLDGTVLLNDENAHVNIEGLVDLSKKRPILNFVANIKHIRFDKLNLSQKYPESFLSFNINANFVGKNIDDAEGSLSIDSILFLRPDKKFFSNQLLIQASGFSKDRKLTIKSDIINGEVTGAYSFTTMFASLKKTANMYLPALINTKEKNTKAQKIETNNLALNFTIGNTQELTDAFNLPVTILSPMKISGFYNNIYNKFRLEIFSPSVQVGKMIVQSAYILTENSYHQINSSISAVSTAKNGSLNEFDLKFSAKNDSVSSNITFSNNGKKTLKGSLITSTVFSRNKDMRLRTDIDILPSQLDLNDTLWSVEKSHIVLDSSYLAVKDFSIHSQKEQQAININGQISRLNPKDILLLNLKSIDLSYIFQMLNIPALDFGGYATGQLTASSIEGKLYTNVNLKVNDLAFNHSVLGNLTLASYLDDETNQVNMKGEILSDEGKKTLIDGFINPMTQDLSINFDADRINVGFLNKYVATLFNNVSGRGSGHVRLFGTTKHVTVEGKAFIENGKVGVNSLNTNYSFSDTIFMKPNLIYFNNIQFNDQAGNHALVSGKVVHDFFANFMYYVGFEGKNFLVYNVNKQQNPTFYGTVFASGTGSIEGDEQQLDINARVTSNKKTKVYMDFMENVANEYSFITYKTPKDTTSNGSKLPSKVDKPKRSMQINMNFYVDATPDASVEMLMDPVGGDKLKGIGSGSLQFKWNTNRDPELYGTYTINRGSYNFTFQKILERVFSIQDGSSVTFNGDPYGANLKIDALYKVTANLNDLDKNLAKQSGQSSVPVNCLMNIKGELKHPNISLDVVLPNADPEIQRQVKSIMSMDDQINRQVVYLLLLSKFYTPNYGETDNTTNSFASVASATLSSQLGNLLNQIDDRLQVGTNIRTSDAQFTATEVELLLSSHLLNDRLILNGNFGYREDPNIQSTFIGDVDIEYLLTNAGNWRIKAYNHSNEKYYILNNNNKAIQTQGIGLMYKKDFDHISEFFNWKPAPKLIKKDSTQVVPDSSQIGSQLGSFIKIKK